MCYAVPGRLLEIRGHIGVVDYFGEKRNILLDDESVREGDYVFAQGGVLVRRIPEETAHEVLSVWEGIFQDLKETDRIMAQVRHDGASDNLLGILQKSNLQKSLHREELARLLSIRDPRELEVLTEVANHTRHRVHGNASCVHGIIEFSSRCRRNCHYCGLRRDAPLERYHLTPEEIVTTAREAADVHGFKALVLQSGEDPAYDIDTLCHLVRRIRALGVLVFLSLGDRTVQDYRRLYDAGARAALLRFETAHAERFARLRPGTRLDDRLGLIRELKAIGYILATGFILGLPGETDDDRLDNILLTRSLAPDMYSFGPLIPTRGTPLETHTAPQLDTVLRTIAVCRLADADANILVTTAMETLAAGAKERALLAGANSLMINATPESVRGQYRIYDNRAGCGRALEDEINVNVQLLYELGRAPTDLGTVRPPSLVSPTTAPGGDDHVENVLSK